MTGPSSGNLAGAVAARGGYRHAALFSTGVGVPVYERIGFRHTGAHLIRYLWRIA